jgi:hypothetical protein
MKIRVLLLGAGIAFHASIAAVLGLWSFGITMAGALLICHPLQSAAMFSINVQRPGARSVVLGEG